MYIPCDVNHALVVSNMHDFDEGTVLIYQKKELGTEVAQYYMETQQYDQVIQTAKKYGKTNPRLWDQSLLYFANEGPKTEDHLLSVLEQLNSRHGSTIRIVDILSHAKEPHLLGAVKNMLIRQLQTQQSAIESDYKEITTNIQKTKNIKEDIRSLQTTGRIFNNHRHLELPTVHFLSGHSYSVADIPDKNKDPQTIETFQILQAQLNSMKSKAMDHSEFFRTLDRSVGQKDEDPFSHVSAYLGRGLLDKQAGGANELPSIDPNLFADLGLKLI